MTTSSRWARLAYLLAAIGFIFAGWREHGLIVPLAGVCLAVVLLLVASHNARKGKADDGSRK